MTCRYAVLLVILTLAACSRGESRGRDTTLVSDSAGVRIISVPASADDTLQLHETLRLGMEDGAGPQLFSRVAAVLLDQDGRIIVGNAGSYTVRVFSHDGALESEFGGRGGGPAEVGTLNDVVRGGDTIGVVDWQRGGRVVFFRRDGTFLHSLATTRADGLRHTPIAGTARGWLWSYRADGDFRVPPGDSLVEAARVGTMSIDSIGRVQPLYSFEAITLYAAPGGEGGVDWGLFRTVRAIGFDAAGRMYRTDPESYRIDVRDGARLAMSVRRAHEPYRITPSDIEQVAAEVQAVLDTFTLPDEEYRRQERAGMKARVARQQKMPIPAVLSPIQNMLVGADGSFWVQLQDTTNPARAEAARAWERDGFPAQPGRWHLYGADGTFVGSVTLPARFRAEAVAGTTVVGVMADSSDVEYIVRFDARKDT